jgi:membrane-associated protease RseP (regulator of RpoE activity)
LIRWLLVILSAGGARAQDRTDVAATYRVPYRLTSTNHVLVRVKINGKGPFNFILDTGAPALFVTTAVGKKIGVSVDKDGEAVLSRFEIEGGVALEKIKGRIEDPFQLEGMNGLGLAGVELHGIIGYTILARYRLEFDFTKPKMGWRRLDYQPPAPQGLGGQAAPAGMDAIGSVMKLLGSMLGKNAPPEITLRGSLGVALEETADSVAIQEVLPQSAAAQAGLRVGDRIAEFQGQPVKSIAAIQRLAAKLTAGETATLRVKRETDLVSVGVKLGRGF